MEEIEFEHISDLIANILKKENFYSKVIIERIKSMWVDIVGTVFCKSTIPLRVNKNILEIGVNNAIYGNQLISQKGKIVAQLKTRNIKINDIIIKQINTPISGNNCSQKQNINNNKEQKIKKNKNIFLYKHITDKQLQKAFKEFEEKVSI